MTNEAHPDSEHADSTSGENLSSFPPKSRHMTTEVDDRGRLYLSKDLRERHGERFRIVDLPSRIVLVPVDDEPLEAVRDAVGDTFEGKSPAELKREAREGIRAEVETEREERASRGSTADAGQRDDQEPTTDGGA